MFARMIVAFALLAGSAVALASDASYDQQQARGSTAPAQTSGSASAPAAPCGCSHARS